MIMRITWGKVSPGQWAAYEQAYKDTVMVKGSNLKGRRGRWLVQDMQNQDAGYSVSLWDSLQDLQAYEQSPTFTTEIRPALQPFFAGEFTTTYCEVKQSQN